MKTKKDFKKEYELYDIPNYSKHGVTRDGRVFTYPCKVHHGKWKKITYLKSTGYLSTHLMNDNGKQETLGIHRILALAFIPNPENKKTVNHKNGIKTDNRIENLEWMSQSENQYHAIKAGLWKVSDKHREAARKTGKSKRALTDEQVREIRSLYEKGEQFKTSSCSSRSLAKKYGVDKTLVLNIINKKTYADVM